MKKTIFFVIFLILKEFSGSEAFVINCIYQQINYNYGIGSVYQCTTANTDFTSDHTVTGVSGAHLAGKSNADVTAVFILGNNNLSFFPRGFTNFFPNVIVCRLLQTQINNLNGDELYEFGENLQLFQLYPGNLITIPSSLFNARPKLVHIDLDSNKIEKVGINLFTPLNVTLLNEVDFSNNRCISRRASGQAAIRTLIDDLKVLCPFDDVPTTTQPTTTTELTTTQPTTTISTTSTTPTTTTQSVTTQAPTTTQPTTTSQSTTTPEATCFVGNIFDFVCDLEEKIDEIKTDLTNTKKELNQTNFILGEFENEMELMKEELIAANLRADLLDLELNQTKNVVNDQQNQLTSTKTTVSELENEQTLMKEEQTVMQEKQTEMQEELAAKDEMIENIQNELILATEKLTEQEAKLEWLEYEVLRLTTHPCSCK